MYDFVAGGCSGRSDQGLPIAPNPRHNVISTDGIVVHGNVRFAYWYMDRLP